MRQQVWVVGDNNLPLAHGEFCLLLAGRRGYVRDARILAKIEGPLDAAIKNTDKPHPWLGVDNVVRKTLGHKARPQQGDPDAAPFPFPGLQSASTANICEFLGST